MFYNVSGMEKHMRSIRYINYFKCFAVLRRRNSFANIVARWNVGYILLIIKIRWLKCLNFFGVIHLLYLDVFVLLPLAGVGVLLAGRCDRSGRRRRRVTGPARLTAWGCVAIAPVGAYATCFEQRAKTCIRSRRSRL